MWYKQVQIAFLIDAYFVTFLIFDLLCFETEGSHQTFAHLGSCLTSGIFWKHLEFYIISHKLRWYLAIIIKNFWYFSWAIFNYIRRYLTIVDDIWRRKRTHLKPENYRPKNIVKYPHSLSIGKRGLKQNIMN